MLQIVEGPPRSGKSYFGVNYLVENYCTYLPLYDEFLLDSNVLVVSNIEGLRVKHRKLDEILKTIPVNEFFTIGNFEKLMEKYKVKNIILLIDEAQFIFDNKFYDKDVFYFFQYHGHIGVDIFLFTQGVSTLCRHFIPLVESIVRVCPRSKSVVGTFRYEYVDKSGNYLYSKVLKKNNLIFKAYKSFRQDEINKPKNALLQWAIMAVVLAVGSVFAFKIAIASVTKKGDTKKSAPAVEPVKPVQGQFSSVKPPAPVHAAPLPSPAALLPTWSYYTVKGYYRINDRIYYEINGNTYPADVCRNYDSVSHSAFCRTADVGPASFSTPAFNNASSGRGVIK